MEEFTRECLEVDKDVNGERSEGRSLFVGTSMEQVYERAARLVKRTLDVEGAIVMDVAADADAALRGGSEDGADGRGPRPLRPGPVPPGPPAISHITRTG